MKVSKGMLVTVEFTISLDDRTIVGSNFGGEPIVFTQGAGAIFPAIERAIEGMEVGKTTRIRLEARETFGPVDPKSIQSIEKSRIPDRSQHVGAQLHTTGAAGAQARVVDIRDEVIVVDFNHPLAGKELSFEIKVLDVQAPVSKN
jgi:FKBP-type peptidyl-prolyl cis-trans isomerase 2